MHPPPNSWALGITLIFVFIGAGVAQVLWLRSGWSRRFMSPIDCGCTFRGRRIFGANKSWRGFLVIVPATGIGFLGFCFARPYLPTWWGGGLWELDHVGYFLAGLWAGFGFMLGELPNSFVKRQLGIAPGLAATGATARIAFGIVDRLDSILGMLVALSLVLPVPLGTWVSVLLIGPGIHLGFSALLYSANVKPRLA